MGKAIILTTLLLAQGCGFSINDTESVVTASSTTSRHLLASCGPPLVQTCASPIASANTTGVPACSGAQTVGASCADAEGAQVCVLDPGFTCPTFTVPATMLICTQNQNFNCPISQAKTKEDIQYLSESQKRKLADEILDLKVANFKYLPGFSKDPSPQLGFIIEDLPNPSPLVNNRREYVNLYGYISSVVVTLQEQDKTIKDLRKEVTNLKRQLADQKKKE